jgi:hypothetical protein
MSAVTVAVAAVAAPGGASGPPPSQPSLTGNVNPLFPAAPGGRVAVVQSGPPYRGVIPILVRNGGSASVERVVVSVTARQPDGKVVARGSTGVLVPAIVRPDGIAIGGIRLRGRSGVDSKYGFNVSSRRRRNEASDPALEFTKTDLSGPMVGSVAQRLTGDLRNAGRGKVRGPVVVSALCLNEASHPVLNASSSTAPKGLRGGTTVPFAIEFPELCPAYLVGARSSRGV